MKKNVSILLIFVLIISCKKPLDLNPRYGFNAEVIYSDPDSYINVLAKLYTSATFLICVSWVLEIYI